MSARKMRTIGSLTHADFGRVVQVEGYPEGVLWSVDHVGAIGDILEPWTRVIFKRTYGGNSEGTRGLPPETPIRVTERAL
jgi:hypothetical protein